MGKRWTNNKDLNDMIAEVERQGWTIVDGGNHLKLVPADKKMQIVVCAKTPSDHRAIKNIRSTIRRNGGLV